MVGADGARSTVRRFVSPDRPDAVYAGFVLWRAMVAEADLPAGIPWLRPDEPSREYYSGPYRLVTYPVPGPDGSSQPGKRRLNVVWYDPARSDLLASLGILEGDTVHGSLASADMPESLRHELGRVASQRWPTPWREALEIAVDRSLVFGTPVVQYRPDVWPRSGGPGRRCRTPRLAHGRRWLPSGPLRRCRPRRLPGAGLPPPPKRGGLLLPEGPAGFGPGARRAQPDGQCPLPGAPASDLTATIRLRTGSSGEEEQYGGAVRKKIQTGQDRVAKEAARGASTK